MIVEALNLGSLLLPAQEGGGGSSLGWLVFLFLIMASGLGAAVYYVRRGPVIRSKSLQKLELLETRPLGGRQFLVVGRYGTQRFLLGVCPGRIDYLSTLEGDYAEVEESLVMNSKGSEEGLKN